VGREKGHRIVAAGDLNVLHGYGEEGSPYWARRYATVFERMRAMGVPFVGPQSPEGRQADPWPAELPRDSRNVPTFRTNSMSPGAEQRQLDHVFASSTLAGHVRVRAVNAVGDWGPSDHCRLEIDLT
jgi:endonuclease/exonuclease/phosphatase family metal-dependent hydrolase